MAETSDSEWKAHPAKKRRDGVHASERWLGGRLILRCYPAAKLAHSEIPRKARNLLKGVSVRAFVKKSAMFISVGI